MPEGPVGGAAPGASFAPPPFQLLSSDAEAGSGMESEQDLPCCMESGGALQAKSYTGQPIQRQDDPEPVRKPIQVFFDKDITGDELIKKANLQIFGRHPGPGVWSNVKATYSKDESPHTVMVDISLLKKTRSEAKKDLGVEVDEEGNIEGADERASEYESMGKGKDSLDNEIEKRYENTTGTELADRSKADQDLWNQLRDELLVEKQYVENLPDKVQLIMSNGLDGIQITPANYEQVIRIAKKITALDLADIENYLRKTSETDSLDKLEQGIEDFLKRKEAGLKKIEEVMDLESDGDWDVDSEAAKLSTSQMFYLDLSQRKKLIDYISDGYAVGDEDEATLIKLIASTPLAQQKALVEWLKKDKSAILKRLESVIHGSENKEYYAALRSLIFQSMDPEEAEQKMNDAKILPWADPGLIKAAYNRRFYYETVEFTSDGRIKVEYWVNIAFMGTKTTTQYFQPDEIIGLYFYMDEDFANATEGQTIYMPAANLISFHNEQFSREMSLVVDVGLLAAGGAGLLAKGGRLAKAVAALDLTLATADIVISSFRQDIAKTPEGKKFLQVWDTVNTLIAAYGLARIVISSPEIFRKLKKAYGEFKAAGHGLDPADIKKLDAETTKLLDSAEGVAFEKRLENLRAKHTPEELQAFEKQLEEAAGLTDKAKQAEALDVIESQAAAQKHNVELVKDLKGKNSTATNKEIADKAADQLMVPDVPMGYTKGEWTDAQAWISQYLEGKGFVVKKGFATGSRITGATFNPKKKAEFGKRKTDFTGSDLDITVVTDKQIGTNQLKKFKEAYKAQFGKELGVRAIPEDQIKQLDYIPIYGKIDMNF